MSVFSLIRKGRAQAKAASKKQAEAKAAAAAAAPEAAPAPYRHVPTHAASDALAGAPQHMQPEDRSRIAAYNRRHSSLPMPTAASSSSSLFRGILPPSAAGGEASGSSSSSGSGSSSKRASRTYSYAGGHPQSWHGRMGEVLYADSGAPPPVPTGLWAENVSGSGGKGKAREESSTQIHDFNAPQPTPESASASDTDPASATFSSADTPSPSSSSIESLSDASRPPTFPAHRLHPAGRPRTASDTRAAAPPPRHTRTHSALSYHTPQPIVPTAQAAGFVFPFSAAPPPPPLHSKPPPPLHASQLATRPATAGAEPRRGPPVSFSGPVAQAVAQAAARRKAPRFTELDDAYSLPALPAFPSLLAEPTLLGSAALASSTTTTTTSSSSGAGRTRRATDAGVAPPLGRAQSGLGGKMMEGLGSSVLITSTVQRPASRQSVASLASVSRVRGLFSLGGGRKLRKGRRE